MAEQKNITFEDVKGVIEDNDLHLGSVNASKIRVFLGRGSLSTIQRHLDELRKGEPSEAVPKVAVEFKAIQMMIEQAVGQAMNGVISQKNSLLKSNNERIIVLLQERDAAQASSDVFEADLAVLNVENEALNKLVLEKENALVEFEIMFKRLAIAVADRGEAEEPRGD